MKQTLKYLFITGCFAALVTPSVAQVQVQQADVVVSSQELRQTNAVVLQQVAFPSHAAGTFVVRFDGTCYADSGDMMILAASHDRDWGVNDGNVGVEVANANTESRGFSHTRIYTLAAGSDTFFAVGQNYVYTSGSGIASVYGSLTVEFWPATGPVVGSSDFQWSGSLSGPQQRMDTLAISNAPNGKVFIHVDGQAESDPGDRIVCTANDAPSWLVGAGSVAFMSYSTSQRTNPYTHSRIRYASGAETYYAMGANVVDVSGSGNAAFYGNLSAEFFPASGSAMIDNTELSMQGLNVRGGPVVMDSITINAGSAGYALVLFDGYVTSSPGDRITLAASNTRGWTPNAGNTTVSALSYANPFNVFSHSRLYPVAAGTHTFYAVAENYIGTAGTGTINIDANLIVKYYPAAGVAIDELSQDMTFAIYPNPAAGYVIVHSSATDVGDITLQDLSGRTVRLQPSYAADTRIDISDLPAGMYLVRQGDHVRKLVKE